MERQKDCIIWNYMIWMYLVTSSGVAEILV